MSGFVIGPIGVLPTGGSPSVPLALDGTPVRTFLGGGGVLTVTSGAVTTTAGDIMVVAVMNGGQAISSVVGSVNGSYAQLGSTGNVSGGLADLWWVLATGGPTETITVNQASGSFCEFLAFGVVGCDTSSPWDPLTGSGFVLNGVFHSTGPTITPTASVPVMLIGAGSDPGGSGPYTADSGWTTNTGFSDTVVSGLVERNIQAAGAGALTFNSTNRFLAGGIGAALKQHP